MQVFVLKQNEGEGVSRIRDIYLTRQDAEDFIGIPQKPTIKCNDCGQQKSNPEYNTNTWNII
jgi:hypothetical protein